MFRYVAIVYPLARRMSQRATVGTIVSIWILAVVCGLPALLASKQEINYFVDERNHIFVDPTCLADNFPDGNALTSNIFAMSVFASFNPGAGKWWLFWTINWGFQDNFERSLHWESTLFIKSRSNIFLNYRTTFSKFSKKWSNIVNICLPKAVSDTTTC